MLQMKKQDVVANNIANSDTTAFKKDIATSRSFPEMLISRLEQTDQSSTKTPTVIGALGTGAVIDGVITDKTQGNLQQTDNPTDLAIKDEGYFAIDTPEGERFTRNGAFKIDGEGLLTTSQGYPVLDDFDDYIYIDGEFTIDSSGMIYVDDMELTMLKIVDFEDDQLLEKQGDVLYATEDPFMFVENPNILQGYLEGSNVNAVKEMVTLINVVRAYETNQKMVQAMDETLDTAINEVGRTG